MLHIFSDRVGLIKEQLTGALIKPESQSVSAKQVFPPDPSMEVAWGTRLSQFMLSMLPNRTLV